MGARKLPPQRRGPCVPSSAPAAIAAAGSAGARPPSAAQARRSHSVERVRHAPRPKTAPIGPSRRHREPSPRPQRAPSPPFPPHPPAALSPPPTAQSAPPQPPPAPARAKLPPRRRPRQLRARCALPPSPVAPRPNHTSALPAETLLDTLVTGYPLPSAIAEIICTQSARYSPPPARASHLHQQPARRETHPPTLRPSSIRVPPIV